MLRRIHLHGSLKAIHPDPIEVDVMTVAEAIELISMQLPGFQPNAITGRVAVQVAGFNTQQSLYAPTDVVDIHLFPPMSFGKNGGILQVVIGIALVVLAIWNPAFLDFIDLSQGALLLAGGLMIIGGLAQILSPQPHSTPENRSKYLSVNQNTVAIGTPIPLLYGRRRVAGQILSLNVQAQDLS